MKPQGDYNDRISAYYAELVDYLNPVADVAVVVVAHMVPNALSFLPTLNKLANIACVLPKPKSENRSEFETIKAQFETRPLSREWAQNADSVMTILEELALNDKRFIIVDIGGYFASSFSIIAKKFPGKLLGVLEGTENGAQKYEAFSKDLPPTAPPVITVARSPLKLPEDYLVASSVVFSIEAVLRAEAAEILQTRRACVIGYGRVGSAVADILRGRGIPTDVFDTDPIKLAEAAAKGYPAHLNLSDAVFGKSLLVCATGHKALKENDFDLLRNGCVVASVTSADDEFDLTKVEENYIFSKLEENLFIYETKSRERHFFMMANGEAVNFLHGAVIGPAMQLIEGEKLASVRSLIDHDEAKTDHEFVSHKPGGINELHKSSRKIVAEIWNRHFL